MVIICTINLFTFVLQFNCPYTVEEAVNYYQTVEQIVPLPIEEIESPSRQSGVMGIGGGIQSRFFSIHISPCSRWCKKTRNGFYVRPRRCGRERSK